MRVAYRAEVPDMHLQAGGLRTWRGATWRHTSVLKLAGCNGAWRPPAPPLHLPQTPPAGGHTWAAARRLADYLGATAARLGLLRPGLRLLELGAGTGWVGWVGWRVGWVCWMRAAVGRRLSEEQASPFQHWHTLSLTPALCHINPFFQRRCPFDSAAAAGCAGRGRSMHAPPLLPPQVAGRHGGAQPAPQRSGVPHRAGRGACVAGTQRGGGWRLVGCWCCCCWLVAAVRATCGVGARPGLHTSSKVHGEARVDDAAAARVPVSRASVCPLCLNGSLAGSQPGVQFPLACLLYLPFCTPCCLISLVLPY